MDYQEDDILEGHGTTDSTEDDIDDAVNQPTNSQDDILIQEIEELREEGLLMADEGIDDEDLAY